MYKQYTRGFTFVEILVVVAIISVLAAITSDAFKNFHRSASLRVASQETYQALVDARNNTLASEGDSVHGVHIEPTKVVRFVGSSYSSTSPANVEYQFEGGVTAATSLTGGTSEIVFERLTGIPNASGNITFSQGSASRGIVVQAKWLIEEY